MGPAMGGNASEMGGMAKTFQEWNPEQSEMFPATPLDMVEKGDLVHVIRSLVLEQLDLREIVGQYREERGNPPFDTTDCQSLSAAGGLHGAAGNAEAGFSDGEFISAASFEGIRELIRASVGTLCKSRISEAGACGLRWDEDASQCQQAQSDELRKDEEGGGRPSGAGKAMVGRGGTAR